MGIKMCLLQVGYDLELQYNALKTFIPDDITFDRYCLIDYYFQKQLDIYPRRDKKFEDLYKLDKKRSVVNFQQFLPIFLLMVKNLKSNKGMLFDIEKQFNQLEMKRTYNFEMIRKMKDQTEQFLVDNRTDRYDMICIGTTDGGVYNAVMMMLIIRENYPEKKIVIGGKAFKTYKELREILHRLKLIDTFVDGDGELALAKLVTTWEFPESMRMDVKNLNDLPTPDPGFGSFLWNNKNESANIYSSRGCAYNCSFCTEGIYPFRCISAERLAQNIETVVKKYNTNRIVISDNLICPSKQYIETFYKQLEKMNLVGKIVLVFVQVPSRNMDEDIVKMMKKLDARVFIGIESFSQRVLDKMKKGTTVQHNIDIVELCLKHDLDFDMGRIMLFPGETMEDFKTSLKYFTNYVSKTIQSVWLNELVLYSSTPLCNNPNEYEIKFQCFDETIQNIVPEVGDIVKRYPYDFIDLTDPDNEIFDRKSKMLVTANEVLSRVFQKKWGEMNEPIK